MLLLAVAVKSISHLSPPIFFIICNTFAISFGMRPSVYVKGKGGDGLVMGWGD